MPLMKWEDEAYLRKDADGNFVTLVSDTAFHQQVMCSKVVGRVRETHETHRKIALNKGRG